MADAQLTIYPTFVIGLGGTGTDIIRYTKRRFLRTWNGQLAAARRAQSSIIDPTAELIEELPAALQVLAVDTEPLINEPEDEPLYAHEFAYMGRFDATRLVQHRGNHGHIYDWWGWSDTELPLGYIHSGAKQIRAIGRLAFFRSFPLFRKMLLKKLDDMRVVLDNKVAQEQNVPIITGDQRLIFVVSSLCGGTGAGMFLDAAYTTRHYCVQKGYKPQIIGIFLLPSTFTGELKSVVQQERIHANAYAALKELHHFHAGYQRFSALYLGEPNPIPTEGHPAFDRIFLVDRSDSEGQALSGRSAAEQMVAQLIHLMAFSHLSKRIVGQGDNASKEQHGTAQDGQGYLSYSSFGVSSLVMPRAALWRYFLSQATAWVIQELYRPEVAPGAVEMAHEHFVTAVVERFKKLHEERFDALKNLGEDLRHDGTAWQQFDALLRDEGYGLVRNQGVRSLQLFLRSMLLMPGEPGHRAGMLTDRDPMDSVVEPPPLGFIGRIRLTPKERLQHDEEVENYEFNQRVIEVWNDLRDRIRRQAQEYLNPIDALEGRIAAVWQQVDRDRQQAAGDLDPLYRHEDSETSTYYDLESGAVGIGQLGDFWQRTLPLLTPQVRAQLLQSVYLNLLQGAGAGDLRGTVAAHLASLREAVDKAFDLRHVVHLQHADGRHPANYRLDQLFDANQPHAAVDGDIHPYSTAMQDPIRLYTRPAAGTNSTVNAEQERLFTRALRNYGDFEAISVDDQDRVDAVNIVHGLPLGQLNSIPEMRKWYGTSQFPKRALHIDPSFADWTDLAAYDIRSVPVGSNGHGVTSPPIPTPPAANAGASIAGELSPAPFAGGTPPLAAPPSSSAPPNAGGAAPPAAPPPGAGSPGGGSPAPGFAPLPPMVGPLASPVPPPAPPPVPRPPPVGPDIPPILMPADPPDSPAGPADAGS